MPETIASVPATFINDVGNGWNNAVTFAIPGDGPWTSGFWDVEYAISQPWFNPTSGVGITLTGGLLAYDGEKNSGRYQFPVTADQLTYINTQMGMTIDANVTGHANAGPDFSLCTLNLVASGGGGGSDGGSNQDFHDFDPVGSIHSRNRDEFTLMPTPANSVPFPAKGHAFNFSGVIKNYANNNPLTGGLTALSATISKDDGSFVATVNSPSEIGTSGVYSLDLTLAEMTASKIVVLVSASNSGAVFSTTSIVPVDLSQFIGPWDQQSPLRFEQMVKQILYVLAFYGATLEGAQLAFKADDFITNQTTSSVVAAQLAGLRTESE